MAGSLWHTALAVQTGGGHFGETSILCGGQQNLSLGFRKNPNFPFLVTFLASACHLKAKSVEEDPKWPEPISMA